MQTLSIISQKKENVEVGRYISWRRNLQGSQKEDTAQYHLLS